MMRVLGRAGREDIALVYLAEVRPSGLVEFVESVQPPNPKSEKWVLIVSTLFGCPVNCAICDAGGWYKGKLSKEEILDQIDFLIFRSFPDRKVPVKKFKIQFARMGEPSLNPSVLQVLEELPGIYSAPGLMPSLSTIAPLGCDGFFEELHKIKNAYYSKGNFQLQFSLHTTVPQIRDRIIPVQKWNFSRIARYGEKFFQPGDRKIALNFALAEDFPLEPEILSQYFSPEIFLIKITPINPTIRVREKNIRNRIQDESQAENLEAIKSLKSRGYEVIISIGQKEENKIGSNCGQFVRKFMDGHDLPGNYAYQYKIEHIV